MKSFTVEQIDVIQGTDKPVGPISVLITTYNEGPMLAEALESVAEQTLLPHEILVIDDGSDPATAPGVIEDFQSETGLAVEYVRQENAGPSAARNNGLRLATQEYIGYLDADDRWLPDHLARKYSRLSELVAIYSTAYDGFVEFDHATGSMLPTIYIGSHDVPVNERILGKPGGIPAGMQFQLHRRKALLCVGGFDESLRINEDFDLLLRLGKMGYWIVGTGKPTVMRRVHPRSITRLDPQRTIRDLECFLNKAESKSLLPSDAIAAKRKCARLSLGKKQVAESATAQAGIKTLREAFEWDTPKGLQQWLVYWIVKSPILASFCFWMKRRIR